MPLRIELAPNERVIIGGVSLRNGSRRSEFVVETQTTILRERDIITQRDADTPAKRLYLTLETAYLSDDKAPAEAVFMAQANAMMQTCPEIAPIIAAGNVVVVLAAEHAPLPALVFAERSQGSAEASEAADRQRSRQPRGGR